MNLTYGWNFRNMNPHSLKTLFKLLCSLSNHVQTTQQFMRHLVPLLIHDVISETNTFVTILLVSLKLWAFRLKS